MSSASVSKLIMMFPAFLDVALLVERRCWN